MADRFGRRRLRWLPGVLVAGLLVAGCSGGDETAADAGGGAAESAARDAAGGDVERGSGGTANRAAVQTRAVIRTGDVALTTADLTRARADIEALVTRHGGYIAQEESSNDGRGRPDHSRLVLRLPAADFDTAMRELAGLGRLGHSHRDTEDVTTEVIDVDTRVSVQEAAVARLERFLSQAENVEDMIRLESEIATRQAALESLKAQQEYLADQTALATITVEVSARPVATQSEQRDTGFLAGLRGGWNALTTVLVTLATVAGAVLPFALTLAVLGLPLWLLVRSATRRRGTLG